MGTGDLCMVHPAAVRYGRELGKFQRRDRVGIVEGSFGYRARGVSIREKSVLSRNLGYEGGCHVAKRSSE